MIKMYYSEKRVFSVFTGIWFIVKRRMKILHNGAIFFAAIVCESRFILKKKLSSSVFIVESYNVILFKVFSKLHFNDLKRYNTRIF